MHLIDTHAHLNFNNYKEDSDEVIRNALREQVCMINVGAEYKTSKRALDIANKYSTGVYAAIGLHPIHLIEQKHKEEGAEFVSRAEEFNYDVYEKLASFEKVVAIGEIGLDYYHMPVGDDSGPIKEKQKQVFYEQMLMARRIDKPVIIHCRQAHDDMVEVIEDFRKENKDIIPKDRFWGVLHCFSGD